MSAYNELIKNFEKIRAYMREFYIYGLKSRDEYDKKSARSYDDERRRMESWLGEHMGFVRTADGKNVFISIDSRIIHHNPLYKPWKAKSFTDGDITLHFILLDILYSPEIALSLADIMQIIDEKYLSCFEKPMVFDESTVRKKLKEYIFEGIITSEKQGKKMMYRRADTSMVKVAQQAVDFFSEVAPCGVIGSFLLDKDENEECIFGFKHHYITSAPDSDITATLFSAMRKKSAVTLSNLARHASEPKKITLVPLRIFISVQNGRQHLLAYNAQAGCIKPYRIDYISDVKIEDPAPDFDELRAKLVEMQRKMWGVNCKCGKNGKEHLEHVEFTVKISPDETYIISRLEREKRIGKVERIDSTTYRFSADVYDTSELIPWIRSFICRIEKLNFSNKTVENLFKQDLEKMYEMYRIGGDKE